MYLSVVLCSIYHSIWCEGYLFRLSNTCSNTCSNTSSNSSSNSSSSNDNDNNDDNTVEIILNRRFITGLWLFCQSQRIFYKLLAKIG